MAVLEKGETSEFIPMAHSEKDVEKTSGNDNVDFTALTFKDFCKFCIASEVP